MICVGQNFFLNLKIKISLQNRIIYEIHSSYFGQMAQIENQPKDTHFGTKPLIYDLKVKIFTVR